MARRVLPLIIFCLSQAVIIEAFTGADSCNGAIITSLGSILSPLPTVINFDNTDATTSSYPTCLRNDSDFTNDIWYTLPLSAILSPWVSFSLCPNVGGSATFNATFAVYGLTDLTCISLPNVLGCNNLTTPVLTLAASLLPTNLYLRIGGLRGSKGTGKLVILNGPLPNTPCQLTTSTGVQTTAIQTTAIQTTQVQTTGVQTTGIQTTQVQTTGVQTTAVQTTDIQTTGVQTTGVQTTGVQTTDIQTTDVQTTDVQTTDVQTTDIQTTGIQTTDVQTTDVQTTGVQTTDVQTTDVQTTDVQTTDVQTTDVQTTDVQTTDIQTTDVQTTGVQTTDVQTTDVQTTDVQTTDVQTTDVQTTDVQTTDIQTTDVQTTDIQTTEIQTTDVQTTDLQTTDVQTTDVQTTDVQSTGIQTTGEVTTGSATTGVAGTTGTTGSTAAQTTDVQTTGEATTGSATTGVAGTTGTTGTTGTMGTTGTTGTTGSTAVQTTDAQTTGVETTSAQTTGSASTGVETTDVQTTDVQTTDTQTTGEATTGSASTAAMTTDLVSTGVAVTTGSTAVQTTDVQTTDIQTTDIQTTDIQTTDIQTTGVQSTGEGTTGLQTTFYDATTGDAMVGTTGGLSNVTDYGRTRLSAYVSSPFVLVANESASFSFPTYNAQGQLRSSGGDAYSVYVDGTVNASQADVVDLGNGTYTVRFAFTRAGNHTVILAHGNQILDTVYPVVVPSTYVSASTILYGRGLHIGVVGAPSSINTVFVDAFGNYNANGSNANITFVFVDRATGNRTTATGTLSADGAKVSYTSPAIGAYTSFAYVNGVAIASSPFPYASVAPDVTDPTLSQVTMTPSPIQTGDYFTVTVKAVRADGVPQTHGGDTIIVRIRTNQNDTYLYTNVSDTQVVDLGNGTYGFSVYIKKTGTFYVSLLGNLSGMVVTYGDATYTLAVTPGKMVGPTSDITSQTSYVAGSLQSFVIHGRDQFGNNLTKGGNASQISIVFQQPIDGNTDSLYSISYFSTVATIDDLDNGSYIVHWRGYAAGTYYLNASIDGVLIGNGEYFQTVLPVPAPVLVSAELGPGAQTLDIKFDSETNQAGRVGKTSCAGLLAPSITYGSTTPMCAFISSKVLRVYFGSDSRVRPGDTISLAVVNSIFNALGNSFATRGSIVVSPLSSNVEPQIVILAPSVVGRCASDSLVINARATLNTGRDPVFQWSVSPIISGMNASQWQGNILTIPNGLLSFPESYTFALTVTTRFGSVSTDTVVIRTAENVPPTVFIVSSNPLHVWRENSLQLDSRVALSTCHDPSSSVSLEWTILSSTADTTKSTFSSNPSRFSAYLLMPANDLQPGTYVFQFASRLSETAFSAANLTVVVHDSPPKAAINAVGAAETSENVAISASASYEYDVAVTSASDDVSYGTNASDSSLSFSWSCAQLLPVSSSVCFDANGALFADPATSDFVLAADTMLEGIYSFTVNVTSSMSGLSSFAHHEIFFSSPTSASFSPLEVTIDSLPSTLVATTSRVVLSGKLLQPTKGKPEWEVVSGNLTTNASYSFVSKTYADGSTTFAIDPNTLLPGQIYLIRLWSRSVNTTAHSDGYADVSFSTDDVPQGGVFTVTPMGSDPVPRSMQTQLWLSSDGWSLDARFAPLYYSFSYISPDAPTEEIALSLRQRLYTATVRIPPNAANTEQKVTLVAYAFNSLGSSTRSTATITLQPVRQTDSMFSASALMTEAERAFTIGDEPIMFSALACLTYPDPSSDFAAPFYASSSNATSNKRKRAENVDREATLTNERVLSAIQTSILSTLTKTVARSAISADRLSQLIVQASSVLDSNANEPSIIDSVAQFILQQTTKIESTESSTSPIRNEYVNNVLDSLSYVTSSIFRNTTIAEMDALNGASKRSLPRTTQAGAMYLAGASQKTQRSIDTLAVAQLKTVPCEHPALVTTSDTVSMAVQYASPQSASLVLPGGSVNSIVANTSDCVNIRVLSWNDDIALNDTSSDGQWPGTNIISVKMDDNKNNTLSATGVSVTFTDVNGVNNNNAGSLACSSRSDNTVPWSLDPTCTLTQPSSDTATCACGQLAEFRLVAAPRPSSAVAAQTAASNNQTNLALITPLAIGLPCLLLVALVVFLVVRRRRQQRAKMVYVEVLDYSDIKFMGPVAGGSYGELFEGQWLHEPKHMVILKKFKKAAFKDDNVKQDLRDLAAQDLSQHENIVKGLGPYKHNGEYYYAMEAHNDKAAADLLHGMWFNLSNRDLLNCLYDVSVGMAALEANDIVHGDLAARTVLVHEAEDRTIIKVADHVIAPSLERNRMPSRVRWQAPEVLAGGEETNKSDVWSFGIFIWELLSNGTPVYSNLDDADVVRSVMYGLRPPVPEHATSEIATLMSHCLSTEAQLRPTFKEIVSIITALIEKQRDADEREMEGSDSANNLAAILAMSQNSRRRSVVNLTPLSGSARNSRRGSLSPSDSPHASRRGSTTGLLEIPSDFSNLPSISPRSRSRTPSPTLPPAAVKEEEEDSGSDTEKEWEDGHSKPSKKVTPAAKGRTQSIMDFLAGIRGQKPSPPSLSVSDYDSEDDTEDDATVAYMRGRQLRKRSDAALLGPRDEIAQTMKESTKALSSNNKKEKADSKSASPSGHTSPKASSGRQSPIFPLSGRSSPVPKIPGMGVDSEPNMRNKVMLKEESDADVFSYQSDMVGLRLDAIKLDALPLDSPREEMLYRKRPVSSESERDTNDNVNAARKAFEMSQGAIVRNPAKLSSQSMSFGPK